MNIISVPPSAQGERDWVRVVFVSCPQRKEKVGGLVVLRRSFTEGKGTAWGEIVPRFLARRKKERAPWVHRREGGGLCSGIKPTPPPPPFLAKKKKGYGGGGVAGGPSIVLWGNVFRR